MNQIAEMLFNIHTHAELCQPEEIVYKEKDVIDLLVRLGHPKAIFDDVPDDEIKDQHQAAKDAEDDPELYNDLFKRDDY